ncbi:sulfite exporter TauE/SafE family protein [bacterium]|nr:sulfite exporter TauE/SafE family protein [bacterium]
MIDFGVFVIAVCAAAVASVTGFGIGSLITPVLSLSIGTKLAVAVVSVPHFVATAMRFWMLRKHVDKKVLFGFGLMSAAGGLMGAFLHVYFAIPALTLIFGIILMFAGFMGASGLAAKMKFQGVAAWLAGGFSGFLGGMVGNQGGIRSAALLGFNISKESFVATATAIGLIVDVSRMPVYFWSEWQGILASSKWLVICTVGVVFGTLLGARLLKRLPQHVFRRVVSAVIFVLGIFMTYRGIVQF